MSPRMSTPPTEPRAMGSAGISLTPLPPAPEVSAWLGEAMPPPGKGVGVGVGGGELLSGMAGGGGGGGGGGMKDGVGDGVRTVGAELGSTTGREVAEGGGGGGGGSADASGSSDVDVVFVIDEMTNVVRGRSDSELKGTGGGCGGDGVGLGEAVGVFCLADADVDDNGSDEPVGVARLGPVDCAPPVAPPSAFGVPVPAPVRPRSKAG
ncbi:hypothetical protein CTA1_13266 [Colletotrichum tanaceti]|uniref:Uncharacterized protein n=1 Tax=Colletotrichum tanaceti TaxID=1306861 RepID=A0A4U6XCJ9_9PEZI|nr:hypothetical protein CTA1_13266 [Colletotrichum tanaceti]